MSIRHINSHISALISRLTEIPSHRLDLSIERSCPVEDGEIPFPDLQLARLFRSRFENNENGYTLRRSLRHEEILTRYFHVADGMHQRGLIPLVHGQSATWMIPQHILKTIGFAQQLRVFPDDSAKGVRAIAQRIDSEMERRASHWIPFYRFLPCFKMLDLRELREHLLSVTIGLPHCEAKESPLSFVFGGCTLKGRTSVPVSYEGNQSILHPTLCREISNRMIAEAVHQRGLPNRLSEHLIAQIDPLYEEAEAAEMGQLLTIGVPYHALQRHAYHSDVGGIPTGLSLYDALGRISAGVVPKEGCQARVVLSSETMDPASGIKVVNIMNRAEVESFTGNDPRLSHPAEEMLKVLLAKKPCPFEPDPATSRAHAERVLLQHSTIIEKLDRLMSSVSVEGFL